jgi:ubiquinone/menaquinone biosynthesis C-methylase UbiE
MTQIDTYDPSFFRQIKKAEGKHFWFNVRRKWIFDKIKKFIPPPAHFLEVGCGTGNVSSHLAKRGYLVTGCEFYPEAIKRAWPDFRVVQGDASNLPFGDNSFDVVGLFDVIEHFQNDCLPIKEAIRVTNREGMIVITVPAREELWSSFDDISFHKRRYTKETLKSLLLSMNLRPLLLEYMFMSLYLPMKYARKKDIMKDDPFSIVPLVNVLLKGLFNMERLLSRSLSLPIGTSLIAIARKQ